MAVERENVETLMEWLRDGGPVRSAHTGAGALAEKLAAVVFDGDREWAANADRIDGYRDRLRDRFVDDSGGEQQFTELTTPDADPDTFVDWFLLTVLAWEDRAAAHEGGYAESRRGWPN